MQTIINPGSTRETFYLAKPGDDFGPLGTAMTRRNVPRGDVWINLAGGRDSVVVGTTQSEDTIMVNAGLDLDPDTLYAFAAPGFGLPMIYGPHSGLYIWAFGGALPNADVPWRDYEHINSTYYFSDNITRQSLRALNEYHGPGNKGNPVVIAAFNTRFQTLSLAGKALAYDYEVADVMRLPDGRLRARITELTLVNSGHASEHDPLHDQAVRLKFNADMDNNFVNPDNPLYIHTEDAIRAQRLAAIQSHIIDPAYTSGGVDGKGWLIDQDGGA